MSAFHRTLVLTLVIGGTALSAEPALQEAAASLGDESFPVRHRAEQRLKSGGAGALALVEPLLDSPEPEVAMRARRIRDWFVLGLDERIPPDLAADLGRFEALDGPARSGAIRRLESADPPHLNALLHLHDRLSTMNVVEAERGQLMAETKRAIDRSAGKWLEGGKLPAGDLGARTRAVLVNRLALSPPPDLAETYAAWQARQPGLRAYLEGRAVELEIERLRATWDKPGALAFAGEIRDDEAFRIVVKEFRDWMLGDPTLDPATLEPAQAIGYLELAFESEEAGGAVPLYRQLRARIPGLDGKLRPSRKPVIEAIGLWDDGEPGQAVDRLLGNDPVIGAGADLVARLMLESVGSDYLDDWREPAPDAKPLGEVVKRLLEGGDDRGVRHALALSRFLRLQDGAGFRWPLPEKDARKLALKLWLEGRDEEAFGLMEEAFWGAPVREEGRLGHFPALAAVTGRLDDALASAASVPDSVEGRDLKLGWLLRAADRTDEALRAAVSFPESRLHRVLLTESENWAALSRLESLSPAERGWFAGLAGELEHWRGHLPQDRQEQPYLQLWLDDHEGLVGEAIRTGNPAGVSKGHYARVLAADLLLGRILRERIERALAEGRPVDWDDVDTYFDVPDALPDHHAAIDLARRLADAPVVPADPTSDSATLLDPTDLDLRARATEALAALGRFDLAKEQLRAMLIDDFDPAALNTRARGCILRTALGGAGPMGEVFLKLARCEKPLARSLDQLLFLHDLLHRGDPADGVAAIMRLAEKHAAHLTDEDVSALIRGCRWFLGQASPQGDCAGDSVAVRLTLFAASLKAPAKAPDAGKSGGSETEILHPEIGDLSDPRAPEFAPLDGLAEVRDLMKQGDAEAAGSRMRGVLIRLLLDDSLRDRGLSLAIRRGGRVRSGAGSVTDLVINAMVALDFPPAMALPPLRTLSRIELDQDACAAMARAFARHGDFDRACVAQHRLCSMGVGRKFHYFDFLHLNELVELEIRRALGHGDRDAAVAIYQRHHRMIPFQFEYARDLLGALREAGDAANAAKLDATITAFWNEKLAELPGYGDYREALERWKTLYQGGDQR